MKTFKSSSGSKEGNCLECDKLIKGKKIKECNDCLEKFCKNILKWMKILFLRNAVNALGIKFI